MDFVDKLYVEYGEVNVKLNKLLDFCNSEKFEGLSDVHKKLLMIQQTVMASYANVLDARIKDIEGGL